MITREADYAVRAILFLAREGRKGPVSSLELSRDMGIPYRFMRRIGLKLQKCGFIESRKGKGGGIKLARPPERISLLDVFNAFDENGFKLNECLAANKGCSQAREASCEVYKSIHQLQELLEAKLAELTFDKF